MKQTKELVYTNAHYELLSEIRNANGGLIYYKTQFTKEENKALGELIKAGEVYKQIERIRYDGRFSCRVTLFVRKKY